MESQADEAEKATAFNDIRAVCHIAKKSLAAKRLARPNKGKRRHAAVPGIRQTRKVGTALRGILNRSASPAKVEEPTHLLPIDTTDFT
ncbi:hypothetical protein ACOMHN_044013 [Nucella lapillus]